MIIKASDIIIPKIILIILEKTVKNNAERIKNIKTIVFCFYAENNGLVFSS